MSGLRCEGLAVGYPGAQVVQPFDLEVPFGSVLALLGPNGAGKTTVMNTIAGLLPSLAGEVRVDGRTLRSGRPSQASKLGITLVADDRALFKSLTTHENLRVAAHRNGPVPTSMLKLFPALERRWEVTAGDLSGGEQQMLAVARALIQEPHVLLIDEMSMGLAPVIVQDLLPVVRATAADTNAAVILVEQHVKLALEVADEAIVLVHGEIALRGPAAELAADHSALEAAYLGGNTT